MALDNPDVIELEMVEDIYTLKRKSGKVGLEIEGRIVHPDITGAKVSEEGALTILGRSLGKLEPSACTPNNLEELRVQVKTWYPPGNVLHCHSVAEYNEKKATGIFVGKFSATWCGPCQMVAPAIEALSLKYPDVTIMHVENTEEHLKPIFQSEAISCYPTFKIFQNGTQMSKIEGADASKVEEGMKALGAVAAPANTTAPIADGDIKFVCARDVVRIERTGDEVRVHVNGDHKPGARCELKNGELSFGRGSAKLWPGGNYDEADISSKLSEWFPTKVKHIHSAAEFDDIIKSGITCAKFSAEWCGPCKAIAGEYHQLSNTLDGKVTFLHIDVDETKVLAQREGIEAMPTFHFYINGAKKTDLMVRGADMSKVKHHLGACGVEL